MNPAKTRSLVGPLVLIGIGIIFLIHNLTEINILKIDLALLASGLDPDWGQ